MSATQIKKTSLEMPEWLRVIIYIIGISTIARFCSGRSSIAYGAKTYPTKTEITTNNDVTLPTTYKMFKWTMKHTEKAK